MAAVAWQAGWEPETCGKGTRAPRLQDPVVCFRQFSKGYPLLCDTGG